MNTKFINAQARHKLHPETFEVPSQSELDNLKEGDIVKVCVCDERFWNRITKIDGNSITAIVDNNLVLTNLHELSLGDTITFKKENIFSIY